MLQSKSCTGLSSASLNAKMACINILFGVIMVPLVQSHCLNACVFGLCTSHMAQVLNNLAIFSQHSAYSLNSSKALVNNYLAANLNQKFFSIIELAI